MKLVYLFVINHAYAITLDACNNFLKKKENDFLSSRALENDLKRCDNLRVRDEKVRVRNALNFFKRLARLLKPLQIKLKVLN
jgi:hypothetical protein